MNVLMTIVLAVQILSAVAMVGLILIQHGKGADMGASFGSGSAGSVFGAAGSANFLSRTTAVLAALFFVTTLGLAYFANSGNVKSGNSGLLDKLSAPAAGAASAPTVDASAPASAPTGAASAAASVPAAPASKPATNEIPK